MILFRVSKQDKSEIKTPNLFQEFIGKLRSDLQESQIRRWSCRIVGILQWVSGKQNTIAVQRCDGFAVFQRVQSEGQSKPFC